MSTGRYRKTPADTVLFRKQYLATLKLQEEINDTNLRANQLYVKTGMPPSVPLDTRTTTELVADVVKLRVDVTTELKAITDGTNAQAIVAGLSAEQLVFVSQHINEIITFLKPKYKYGVPSQVFLTSFLPNYMNNEFRQQMAVADLPQNVFDLSAGPSHMPGEMPGIKRPRPDQNPSSSASYDPTVPYGEEGEESINTEQESINTGVLSLKSQFDRAIGNQDVVEIRDIGFRLLSSPLSRSDRAVIIGVFEEYGIEPPVEGKPVPSKSRDPPIYGSPNDIPFPTQDIEAFENLNERNEYMLNVDTILPLSARIKSYSIGDEGREHLATFRKTYMPTEEVKTRSKLMGGKQFIVERVKELETLILPKTYKYTSPGTSPVKSTTRKTTTLFGKDPVASASIPGLLVRYSNLNQYLATTYNEVFINDPLPEPVSGWGVRMRGHGVGDRAMGISPALKWASFGKYKIDVHKLDDGILQLRTHTGSTVGKYPTQKLPSASVPVIKSFLQDKQPSFEILSNLSAEDKAFIKRLTKASCIFQHVGEGLPSNPSDDEDIKEFEIMRGEIISGNNSKVLVHNFKKQIIKLMHRDLLPKSQGKDLLLELATLEY